MIKVAASAAISLPAATLTATPIGAAVFLFLAPMVGALRVAASAATPRATAPPTTTPIGVVEIS